MLDSSGTIAESANIVKESVVIGDVSIGAHSTVLFGAVLRGDDNPIIIGEGTNVQDNCVIHVDKGYSVTVGKNVTIGHSAIVHGCSVGDNTLIGMGAIVLNGASIGKNCIVGAGALVTQNMQIPEGSLVYGSPAKIIRSVTEAEIASNLENAAHYVREGQEYAKHLGKGNESHEG